MLAALTVGIVGCAELGDRPSPAYAEGSVRRRGRAAYVLHGAAGISQNSRENLGRSSFYKEPITIGQHDQYCEGKLLFYRALFGSGGGT